MEYLQTIAFYVAAGTLGCLLGILTSDNKITLRRLSTTQVQIAEMGRKIEDLDRRLKLIEKIDVTSDGRMVFGNK